jgi:uncharacterized protein (TIGR03083 family)
MTEVQERMASLWASHHRLDAATRSLTADQVTRPSYCTEWTIAQVLSHLGSGSQLFELRLEAGLAGTEPPEREASPKVWAVWDAMQPVDQVRNSVATDSAFLQRVDDMPAEQLDLIHMALWGQEVDAAGLLTLRLNEHTIHTWDVLVMSDPSATLAVDAATVMIDRLDILVRYTAKTRAGPIEADITTTDPVRHLRLSVSDTVTLRPHASDTPPATSSVRMPAEALIRLVYGRLDPDHTPSTVTTEGIDLDALRATFPGV